TADLVPVAMVSLCSCPGSRRCTCMSMRPGHSTRPEATSTTCTSPSRTGKFFSTRAILPSSMRTSYTPSIPLAGSTTRPPLSSRFILRSACQQVQHGHPHRHPVGHLFKNHRVGPVSHLGSNLDAPVHGPGVHDDHIRAREGHAVLGHPEHVEVLAQRREERALHPFELDAEHHDHVGVAHGVLDGVRDLHAEPL